MRHAVRAARALAFLGVAACSAHDDAPPRFDFDPDVGVAQENVTVSDDASVHHEDASDAPLDGSVRDARADAPADAVYQDSWHEYDANCFLDAAMEDAVSDGSNDADATPKTCVCFFEDPLDFPCLPPCITADQNDSNGCVPGPLPPPDLPAA